MNKTQIDFLLQNREAGKTVFFFMFRTLEQDLANRLFKFFGEAAVILKTVLTHSPIIFPFITCIFDRMGCDGLLIEFRAPADTFRNFQHAVLNQRRLGD